MISTCDKRHIQLAYLNNNKNIFVDLHMTKTTKNNLHWMFSAYGDRVWVLGDI